MKLLLATLFTLGFMGTGFAMSGDHHGDKNCAYKDNSRRSNKPAGQVYRQTNKKTSKKAKSIKN